MSSSTSSFDRPALFDPVLLDGEKFVIRGGFTRRNPLLPENGNTALHVCQNEKDVMKSRRILERETLPLERWVLPWQKHTDHIERVGAKDAGRGAFEKESSIMETDSVYTTDPNLMIGVFTADCLGILIADPDSGLIAAVHSGWKGTVQNILKKTLEKIFEKNLARPESTQIFFSPSIGPESFQIGQDVKNMLLDSGKEIGLDYSDLIIPDPAVMAGPADLSDSEENREPKWLADHQAMNVRIAKMTGIPEENIHVNIHDTKTDSSCFSYRRDGSKTGEHLSFLYMERKVED